MKKYLSIAFLFVGIVGLQSQSFEYDDHNRFAKVDFGTGYTISYEYDKLGNRTKNLLTGVYHYSAKDSILLLSDFEVQTGVIFITDLMGCSN